MNVLFGGKFRPIAAARDTWYLPKTFHWRVAATDPKQTFEADRSGGNVEGNDEATLR
jgi:hypothetical protein